MSKPRSGGKARGLQAVKRRRGTRKKTYDSLLDILCCSRCGTNGKCKCNPKHPPIVRLTGKARFHEWQTDAIAGSRL